MVLQETLKKLKGIVHWKDFMCSGILGRYFLMKPMNKGKIVSEVFEKMDP